MDKLVYTLYCLFWKATPTLAASQATSVFRFPYPKSVLLSPTTSMLSYSSVAGYLLNSHNPRKLLGTGLLCSDFCINFPLSMPLGAYFFYYFISFTPVFIKLLLCHVSIVSCLFYFVSYLCFIF